MVPQRRHLLPLLLALAGAQLAPGARQVSGEQRQAGIRGSRHHKHLHRVRGDAW